MLSKPKRKGRAALVLDRHIEYRDALKRPGLAWVYPALETMDCLFGEVGLLIREVESLKKANRKVAKK